MIVFYYCMYTAGMLNITCEHIMPITITLAWVYYYYYYNYLPVSNASIIITITRLPRKSLIEAVQG